jgi:hypothetical protein
MKMSHIAPVLTMSLIVYVANGAVLSPAYADSSSPRFYCGISKNVPTTLGRTNRGSVPIIRWVFKGFGENYSPAERCKLVSGRFQAAYENGTLNFLKAAYLNRNPVICAVANRESPCSVLFTLKPGSDPNQTLRQLLDLRTRATTNVINESITPTPEIDINDFLANAPVDGAIAEQQPSPTVLPKSKPAPKMVPSSQPPSSNPGNIW